eukprot:gb/GEZJ01001895.1/.p3 GENE.gb/GEZJ01001895.1/~~gb/GEZJ01001895.1/.p3  ORF type:complete len:178 (+),score=19.70 gb/GEZJ01001895.1/:2858-3391(+)
MFSFEPLHNFHLGISKLIKLAIIERLKSKDKLSNFGPSSSTSSFKNIGTSLFKDANNILVDIELHFPAPGLHIDFSTAEKGNSLNGFFTPDGIKGMVEPKEYRALDVVFPFIGAFFDRCCDKVDTAPIPSILTLYTDLVNNVLHYHDSPEWTQIRIRSLKILIKNFKFNHLSILGPF